MGLKVATLVCEDCRRQITEAEWSHYVGDSIVLGSRIGRWLFYCGCRAGRVAGVHWEGAYHRGA